MTLIVEDGTGFGNADSYISVADADAYHASRGRGAWDALDDELKESSLRLAAESMSQAYRLRWAGYRVNDSQSMDWPRAWVPRPDMTYLATQGYTMAGAPLGVYLDETQIPREIPRAQAEFALRIATNGDLAPDIDTTRAVKRQKVDVIEVEYETTDEVPSPGMLGRYTMVEAMLYPYLKSITTAIPIVRV